MASSPNNPAILIFLRAYYTQDLLTKALYLFMAGQLKYLLLSDRRSGNDRRSCEMPEAKSLFIYVRRKKIRRQDDEHRIFYFDQYSSALFAAIIFILFLNIIDVLLTLLLVDYGAVEINPVMAYFLDFGPLTFMIVKYFFACFSVIVLLIFNNVFIRGIKSYTRSLFSYAICVFMAVVAWQLYLTFHIVF